MEQDQRDREREPDGARVVAAGDAEPAREAAAARDADRVPGGRDRDEARAVARVARAPVAILLPADGRAEEGVDNAKGG